MLPAFFNNISIPKQITDKRSVIIATGGFSVISGIKPNLTEYPKIAEYDLSGSVQLLFDISKINKKFGLFKNRYEIVNSMFDIYTGTFPIDTINITANEIVNELSVYSIISIGKLESLNSDFMNFMNSFFDYKAGFDIKINPTYINLNNGIFDIQMLYDTIKKENGFFGTITVKNINEILNNINNIFENRQNVGINDGFIGKELIYIPHGITMLLVIDIDMDELKVNNIGKQFLAKLKRDSDYDDVNSSVQTIISSKKIMRIIKVPLVLNLIQFDLPIPIIQKPPVINKNDNEKIPLLENNFYSEPEFTVSVQQTNYSYHMSSNRISSDELQKYIK
jgi:hypothetical protein